MKRLKSRKKKQSKVEQGDQKNVWEEKVRKKKQREEKTEEGLFVCFFFIFFAFAFLHYTVTLIDNHRQQCLLTLLPFFPPSLTLSETFLLFPLWSKGYLLLLLLHYTINHHDDQKKR